MKPYLRNTILCIFFTTNLIACQNGVEEANSTSTSSIAQADQEEHEDHDAENGFQLEELGCIQPTAQQRDPVDLGNDKKDKFLDFCRQQTGNSPWCDQLVRPNPSSTGTFRCTYGPNQIHQLIHPNEQTWIYATRGVQLIQELAKKGIRTCQIYNWWRPEPYNKNVGGAPGRHPYGTAIDVRLCSNKEAILAFNELCKLRKTGKIRAIGYYGGSSLHFGVGDKTANTWGKSCPN